MLCTLMQSEVHMGTFPFWRFSLADQVAEWEKKNPLLENLYKQNFAGALVVMFSACHNGFNNRNTNL